MVSISTDTVSPRHTAIIVGIATALATVLATYVYQKLKKPKIPVKWKPVAKVIGLSIYPLKSGKKIAVEEAECTKQGLKEMEKPDQSFRLRDRSFVVYHEHNHEFRNARHYPKLLQIEVKANDKNSVVINAPDMETLFMKVPSEEEHGVIIVKQFKQEEIKAIDCGDEAATWISKYILEKEHGLRLAYNDGRYKRTQINTIYKNEINFYKSGLRNESSGLNSDLAAMHLINKASVLDFNERMGNSDISIENFRPTLIVDGPNLEPFEEDSWEWIKIGNVIMKNVYPCFRCILTTIDFDRAVRRQDREPLKTLERYRLKEGPEKTPAMGTLLEVFDTGVIAVGETVYVGSTL